jgi:adenylate cyclase
MKHSKVGINHKLLELTSSLDIEVQKNERFRALLLAGLSFMILIGFVARTTASPYLGNYLLSADRIRLGWLLLASFGVYEAGFGLALHRLLLRKRQLPHPARFGNSAFEILYMYLISWVIGRGLPPALVVDLPTTYLPFVLVVLSSLRMSVGLSLWAGLVAAAGYVGLYMILLNAFNQSSLTAAAEQAHFDLFLNGGRIMAFMLIGVGTAIVGSNLSRWMLNTIKAHDDQERVLHIFGQQVSPEVREKLLAQETAGADGEIRNVCVLFVDIRNFTAFSESKTPEAVVAFLNTMFSFMVDEIISHGGIVNKFLGDGFMAVFGAPLDDPSASRNALAAANSMLQRLDQLKADGQLPDVQLGIGLNAGGVLTGQVGPEKRREYTIIGDVVNLASRLESMNKEYGTRLIASEYVVAQLEAGEDLTTTAQKYQLAPLGAATVRGRTEPVQIFRG